MKVLCSSLKVALAVTVMSPKVDSLAEVELITGTELCKVTSVTSILLSYENISFDAVFPNASVIVNVILYDEPSTKSFTSTLDN